jgi:hypothetical protein
VKRTTRRVLEALLRYGPLGGEQLTAYGGGHEATARAREINADPSIPYRIVARRTALGRWIRSIEMKDAPRDEQLGLGLSSPEPIGQLRLWDDEP